MRKKILLAIFISAISFGTFATVQPAPVSANSDVVVQAIPGPSLTERLVTRAKSSWPWYVVRASGFIAAASLIILILSGIGQVSGYTYRFLEPLTAWATHRALGIAFSVSVLIHMFGLLFDNFTSFHILDLFIPWLSNYKTVTLFGMDVGSIYIALGVLAFYLTAIVVIVSLLWVEKKPRLWKWTHLLSYLIMIFVFIHALYLGSDLTDGLPRLAWIAGGIVVAFGIVYRLWRAKTV